MGNYEKWSYEEEEALLGGIEKYGVGKWKLILQDPNFGPYLSNRSNSGIRVVVIFSTKKCLRESFKGKVREVIKRNGLMPTHPSRTRSSRKKSKNVVKDDSDSEDYRHQCTELSNIEAVEELSGPEEYHFPRIITRQSGRACNNIHTRKLNCYQVHTYLENLWCNIPEDKSSSFAHLDPLWYTCYSNNSKREMVLKWIKNKDPFSKKYVVFPIVHGGHWSVLIFCHFGECLGSEVKTPCILLLDSLEKAEHSKQVEPVIRKFVLDVLNFLEMTEAIKMLRKMPFLVPKVPQQRDKEECGYFVLYYIKLFVENAPESFSTSNGYPYFMKQNWFTYEGLDNFCKSIDLSPN